MSKNLKFSTYSLWTREKDGYNFYDWCVFIDEGEEILDSILEVEYQLHPTFPDPVRVISDRETKFALMSSGWGGFTIRVRVKFKDDSINRQQYNLSLVKDSWPKNVLTDFRAIDERLHKVYSDLPDGKRNRWRKVSSISNSTQMPENEVEHALKKLEELNLIRKSFFSALDGNDLWGATSVVGISPKYSPSSHLV